MLDLKKISVVLPSLDPDDKLLTVVDGLLERGFTDIILVNDGSKPENEHYFETAASHPEVHLLTHAINRGKGAALKTAFTWFLENRPDQAGVVTVDGDNQHHPEDTKACALHTLEHDLVTLGCRDFSLPDVPARSSKGNRITRKVMKIFCGVDVSDTQTGLRAIPRKALEILATVKGDRFEYETNMLLALKENRIAFDEVKIRTVYIEENKSSHFRVVRDSWRIYRLILGHFFKYAFSSLVSTAVELVIFPLINMLFTGTLTGWALSGVTVVGSRAVSSSVNFYLNKKLVFRSQGRTGRALLRYCMLAAPTMVVQWILDQVIYSIFSVGAERELLRTVIHACVMTCLFVVNFIIQQRWVFTAKSVDAERKAAKKAGKEAKRLAKKEARLQRESEAAPEATKEEKSQ